MISFPIAFLMGFLGSLHCAVMCGPIVLGLPLKQHSNWYGVFQVAIYQLGRVCAYILLGLLIGLVGKSITFYAKQEALTTVLGVILIIMAILQLSGSYSKQLLHWQKMVIKPISKLMGNVLNLKFWGFFAGFLNGLIPCGMVYMALAIALNLADATSASKFMLLFGLGTTPLMFTISLGGIYLKRYINFNAQKIIPWFMLLVGVLFLFRSLNLDIPFISPLIHTVYGKAGFCN